MWINLLLISGPIGVTIGYVTKKKYMHSKSVVIIIAAVVLSSSLWYIAVSELVVQTDVLNLIKEYVLATEIPQEFYNNLSELDTDVYSNLEFEAKQLLLATLPSIVLCMMTGYALLNFVFLNRILKQMGKSIKELPPLYEFRLPENIIMGTFIILVLTLITTQFSQFDGFSLMLNVMNILMVTFSLQGLAVLSHFLKRFKVKGFVQIPVLIIGLFLLQFIGLSLMGWLDTIFDIRRLKKNVGDV
jgi:uncharacterized protein YybS (DUF2232 family)